MAVLESGELKGKKIGTSWRISRAALNAYLVGVASGRRSLARSRNTPARRAARRRNGIRPSRSWSARSAAPSRRTRSIATTGKVGENATSTTALRRRPAAERDVPGTAPQRAVPELPRDDGLRRGARRAELRVLRIAGAGRLRGDQVADLVPKACCRFASIAIACATTSAAGGAASGWRPAGSRRRRSSTPSKPLHSVLDVRCAARIARGTPRPATTTTSTSKAATARAIASSGRSGACAGKPRPAWSITPSTMSWCRGRRASRSICCARSSRFRPARVVPYDTAFLSGHVVEHYQVALTEAAGNSEAQMRATLEQLCAQQVPGDTHRNLVIHPAFSGQHVQARAGADLAARLHVRLAQRSRWSSTATPAASPAGIRTARGRSPS